MLRSLYIASTQGSGGKTTIAVGLCMALRERGLDAGYFKPVGTLAAHADGVLLDEDAEFVAELLELDDDLTDICPVVLDEDALHDVLSGTEVDAMARVKTAYERIRAGRDIVVCEGLGEIWQGRFLRTSGAEVVAELHLGTLLVAKFAGARLLDDIIYVKDALKEHLLGVLFNMVPESRLPLVQDEYTRFLAKNDIESYGALVSSAMLSAVSVAEIVEALDGTFVSGERYGDRLAETYMIGAMSPEHALQILPAHAEQGRHRGWRPRRDRARRAGHAHRGRAAHRQLRAEPRGARAGGGARRAAGVGRDRHRLRRGRHAPPLRPPPRQGTRQDRAHREAHRRVCRS